MDYSNVTYFAETNFRNKRRLFGIKQKDRLLHSYIIGKTGTGKTNLILTKLIQDIDNNRGLCLIDVHGDLITKIFKLIPDFRKKDVIYLDLTNPKQNFKFNPLIKVPFEKRSLVVSGLLDVFQKLWKSAWGIRLEHILRYILLTLLDQKEANMSHILKIIQDEDYRNFCVKNIVNKDVKNFWKREFEQYSKADILPILNKVGAFLAYPSIKRLLITNKENISFREIMDNKEILLVNLSKGALGEDVSNIVGSFILSSLSFSAFSRIDMKEEERIPFFVYLDEFQNFTTLSLVNMLSELRKFKLSLILSHQYLEQLNNEIKNAVLGNVGTIISFRLGTLDAQHMAKEFYPVFEVNDIINLGNYEIYLKLMIDGRPSKPFSGETVRWVG